MKMGEFDQYADQYERHVERAMPFANCKVSSFTRIKVRRMVDYLSQTFPGKRNLNLLDAGCGVGLTDEILKQTYPNVTGLDVSERSLALASRRNPDVSYSLYDGGDFPFTDKGFDVVFAICVMHHIPPTRWAHFLVNAGRVLKPGGAIMIFEHNPLNPLTRWIVSRCEFDRGVQLLSAARCRGMLESIAFQEIRTDYLLFAPWEAKAWQRVESKVFRNIPLGAQYGIYGKRRKS